MLGMDCPVCFEIYRNPLLLPGCGHTICQACAELLVTDGNFLRCPECRLIYQLRRGVKSLPRNVALQRTIEEHNKSTSRSHLKCDAHPEEAVSLYCKTCEKAICLKCYFSSNGAQSEGIHSGHQVDTSEDAYSRERRLLEEKCHDCELQQKIEEEYIAQLEESETALNKFLDEKLASIDEHKHELISQVKQTSAKLKFTLKGSVARDMECLKTSLQAARERLVAMETVIADAGSLLNKTANDSPEINLLKTARKNLEELPDTNNCDRPRADGFSKVQTFDTDLQSCLSDAKKALSYQTECPKAPVLSEDGCVISSTSAFIPVQYNETVRVKRLVVFFKEAIYKGLSEKDWDSIEAIDVHHGTGKVLLTGLKQGTMYKLNAIAYNDIGASPTSNELWFRTVDCTIETRVINT